MSCKRRYVFFLLRLVLLIAIGSSVACYAAFEDEEGEGNEFPTAIPPRPAKRVGVFYLLWHTYAAKAMAKIPASERFTMEDVIRDPALAPSSILERHGLKNLAQSFHYHVEPELGFYCMYRPRPGEAPYADAHRFEGCDDIAATAKAHAEQILAAGIDFVFVDLTNLPFQGQFTDVLGVRPLEVLLEEWARLREQGIPTPDIAAWVPMSAPTGGQLSTWRQVTQAYNKPRYADLILRDKDDKKIMFAVASRTYPVDPGQQAEAESNEGKSDVIVVPMWALLNESQTRDGVSSWMQPCEENDRAGQPVFTPRIRANQPCEQKHTANSPIGSVVSASISYQLAYASLPYMSTSRNNGLTFKKQFATALDVKPDWLLLNSWNEFIAQPQSEPNYTNAGPLGRSMGILPTPSGDSSDEWLWVDMYGAEFSRDIEPTKEYGDGMYKLVQSCLRVYRGNGCESQPQEACCQLEEEHTTVWSARFEDPDLRMDTRHILTTSIEEGLGLLQAGQWEEVCTPGFGPPEICSHPAKISGDGPFMLFARDGENRTSLYRCRTSAAHFFSTNDTCEGQVFEGRLGYVSTIRTSESPRPLSRCRNTVTGTHFHWLTDSCPTNIPNVAHEAVVGYVR